MIVMRRFFVSVVMVLSTVSAFAQLVVTGNQSAAVLAQTLAGPGVTISNAVLNCDTNANALFATPPPNLTNLGLDEGIVLTSGNAYNYPGNTGVANPPQIVTGTNSDSADADLALLITQSIRDACKLEFDFVPTGDTVKFEYVFASCEYPGYTCSINDVFGFFISGPGITGTFSNNAINIAIVPGTTSCPVGVNTINCPNSTGCCNTSTNCVANGAGCGTLTTAATCALFVCNAPPPNGNQNTIVYPGFTVPLTAVAVVQPCSTYHLKLAISDASDQILDSGVFLKAGSLTSNSVSLTPVSPLSIPNPYVVEGCVPGGIVVSIPVALTQNFTVHYTVGGNAINGTDYSTIADSVVILAGNTTAVIPIVALNDGIAEGPETVVIYKQIGCTGQNTDSATILIYDSLQLQVLSADTFICAGDTMQVFAVADTLLSLSWTPSAFVSNDTILNPFVYPTTTTTFVLTASLANSGCPPVSDEVVVNINPQPAVNIGADVFLCRDMQYAFNPTVLPQQAYTYSWTPTTFLSNPNSINPVGTFTTVGTFSLVLQADPQAIGCAGWDTVVVEVLPNDIFLVNNDTSICLGQTIQGMVIGDPRFSYSWSPPLFANNASLQSPMLTPNANTTFTVVASYPGCPPMVHDFIANVEPVPTVNLGPDRSMCLYDTIQLEAAITPSTFNNFIYSWAPTADLSSSNTANTVFSGSTTANYTLSVTTPLANCLVTDAISLTVWPGDFAQITVVGSNTLCPGEIATVAASGAVSYNWQPDLYVGNHTSANTTMDPVATQTYTLYAQDIHGCYDTNWVEIIRVPAALVNAGPDVTLYPGDTYTFPTRTNGSTFQWTPPAFLNATNVLDPTVSNAAASTQYVVQVATEYDCFSQDTVIVSVSPTSRIAIPNAFTPGNGSGINDYFSVDHLGLVSLEYLRVYNRWGQLIFETNNLTQGWDGKYKGQPQPMGTYVYELSAKDNKGTAFLKSGNVTLVR
jgi:gliding motility-associated-like protein